MLRVRYNLIPNLKGGHNKLKIWKKSYLQTEYENVLSLEWSWTLTKNLPSVISPLILLDQDSNRAKKKQALPLASAYSFGKPSLRLPRDWKENRL